MARYDKICILCIPSGWSDLDPVRTTCQLPASPRLLTSSYREPCPLPLLLHRSDSSYSSAQTSSQEMLSSLCAGSVGKARVRGQQLALGQRGGWTVLLSGDVVLADCMGMKIN